VVKMKRKTPAGIRVLRVISIAITIVVMLLIGSVVYSAYEDYSGVTRDFGSSGSGQVTAVQQGTAELVSLNVTIPNKGLFTLNVTVTCTDQNPNIACDRATVSVPPGGQDVLRFHMTIKDVAAYQASADHRINGTVTVELVPYTSLSVGVDLASLVNQGGA
jgi:hypothetical protein